MKQGPIEVIEVEAECGDKFYVLVDRAKERLQLEGGGQTLCRFVFNGMEVMVSENTNPELLWRDYDNASLLGDRKSIGPDCAEVLSAEETEAIRQAEKIQKETWAKETEEALRRQALEIAAFKKKTVGVRLELKPDKKELYFYVEDLNSDDDVGRAIIAFGRRWARLMQYHLSNGLKLEDVAEDAMLQVDFDGLSGGMISFARCLLIECWVHGEELQKWYEKWREDMRK